MLVVDHLNKRRKLAALGGTLCTHALGGAKGSLGYTSNKCVAIGTHRVTIMKIKKSHKKKGGGGGAGGRAGGRQEKKENGKMIEI